MAIFMSPLAVTDWLPLTTRNALNWVSIVAAHAVVPKAVPEIPDNVSEKAPFMSMPLSTQLVAVMVSESPLLAALSLLTVPLTAIVPPPEHACVAETPVSSFGALPLYARLIRPSAGATALMLWPSMVTPVSRSVTDDDDEPTAPFAAWTWLATLVELAAEIGENWLTGEGVGAGVPEPPPPPHAERTRAALIVDASRNVRLFMLLLPPEKVWFSPKYYNVNVSAK
ncbi:MAG: hypothetical protein M3R60_12875 [Pseudomonadota bacterium]|nr:hypothetical protein [Pseudomonadota bacterium]